MKFIGFILALNIGLRFISSLWHLYPSACFIYIIGCSYNKTAHKKIKTLETFFTRGFWVTANRNICAIHKLAHFSQLFSNKLLTWAKLMHNWSLYSIANLMQKSEYHNPQDNWPSINREQWFSTRVSPWWKRSVSMRSTQKKKKWRGACSRCSCFPSLVQLS